MLDAVSVGVALEAVVLHRYAVGGSRVSTEGLQGQHSHVAEDLRSSACEHTLKARGREGETYDSSNTAEAVDTDLQSIEVSDVHAGGEG